MKNIAIIMLIGLTMSVSYAQKKPSKKQIKGGIEVAKNWTKTLSEAGDQDYLMTLVDVPFTVEGKENYGKLDEVKAFHKKVADKKGARVVEITSAELYTGNDFPEKKGTLYIRIKIKEEGRKREHELTVVVRGKKKMKVVGFYD